MTLLCAVFTDNSVLLAGDACSTVYELQGFPHPFPAALPTEKFRTTSVETVMWAYSGYSQVVEPVADWALRQHAWSSWQQVAAEVKEKRNEGVKRARTAAVAEGGRADDPRLSATVVFGGYVKKDAGVIVVGEGGIPLQCSPEEKYAPQPIGGGQTVALAAWNVLKSRDQSCKIETPQELADFMNAVCDSVAALYAPVQVWEVTPEGSHTRETLYSPSRIRMQC